MTVVVKEEGRVTYELSAKLKRRTHIRAILLRAKTEFSKGADERVNTRPTSN